MSEGSERDELLYLRCDCHTPYHCLVVERDPDIAGAFDVQFVSTSSGSFWHRVKYGLRHIFKADMLVEADIILSVKDADRVIDYLSNRGKTQA